MTIAHSSNNVGTNASANGTALGASSISVNDGDLIVYYGSWQGGGSSDTATISISDDDSNTYSTPIYKQISSGRDFKLAMAWAQAGSTTTISITSTISAGRDNRYSGVAIFSTDGTITLEENLDGENTSTTSPVDWSVGTFTHGTNELLIGYARTHRTPTVHTPGTGYSATLLAKTGTCYRVTTTSSTDDVDGSFTVPFSSRWAGMALRFSEASGNITPDGIASAEAFGSATVTTGEVTITPNGIATAEAVVDRDWETEQ